MIQARQHETLHNYYPTLQFVVLVSRVSDYYVLSTIVPIILINLLIFLVFFIKRKDLKDRLQLIVTLYLALAASSFFLEKPKSDRPLLPDILGLQAYLVLTLTGLESVLVYFLTRREILT